MNKKMSPSFIKAVNILKDGDYHDGTTMGESLNMTRSAVWKVIKKLENYDVRIDSIKGRGYALLEPLILLERNKIKQHLADDKIDLEVYETISSTNDYLKTVKNNKAAKICLAEQQTNGKGRLNREWYSPFGKNIYLSCLYSFRKDISELAGLSLAASLGIIKTLKQYQLDDKLYVKWPNDVMYDHKKLSGCLIEIQAESHGLSHVIIGIGMNVNMLDAENNIPQSWTSMQKILGKYVDRNILCAELINNLLSYLQEFDQHGFTHFAKEWNAIDGLLHQTVHLKNVNSKIKGKVKGVNAQGHLLLQMPDGATRAFSSGDTSVVKER